MTCIACRWWGAVTRADIDGPCFGSHGGLVAPGDSCAHAVAASRATACLSCDRWRRVHAGAPDGGCVAPSGHVWRITRNHWSCGQHQLGPRHVPVSAYRLPAPHGALETQETKPGSI